MPDDEIELFYPKTKLQWRKWLMKNHLQKKAVWLILFKKNANKPTISWSDAVDEALCFGWIDSIRKKLDEERSIQFFSKRKPKSTWSKINKEKIEKLITTNQMTQAGLDCITIAKQNGTWEILDTVEALLVPADLEVKLKAYPNALEYFMSLSKSVRKMMLQWIVLAKRDETRAKRIAEIVTHARKKQKPKQF